MAAEDRPLSEFCEIIRIGAIRSRRPDGTIAFMERSSQARHKHRQTAVPFHSRSRNLFRFPLVDPRYRIAGVRLCLNQRIQLRMDRLRISVLGTLYEQRHEPSRKRGNCMPVKCARLEHGQPAAQQFCKG